ncbi:MAG: hypothetical protein HQL38_01555 [Alphaproteobacteria bacterium]|nr:hypothetical protein [Alphaproteobacteria bacterium]
MQTFTTRKEIDAAFVSGVISQSEALRLYDAAPITQVVRRRSSHSVNPSPKARAIMEALAEGKSWAEVAAMPPVHFGRSTPKSDPRQQALTFEVFLDPWTPFRISIVPAEEMEPLGDISQLGRSGPAANWADIEANHPRMEWNREAVVQMAETLLMTAIHALKDRRVAAAVRQENIEWICRYSQRGLSFDVCCELVGGGLDAMELRENLFPLIGITADGYDWNRMVAGGLLEDAIHVLTSSEDQSVTTEERWAMLEWVSNRQASPKGFVNLCHRLSVDHHRLRDLLIARAWWLPE